MTGLRDSEVSVYDRLVWPDGALETLLANGDRRRELVAYLGEDEYEALQPLALAAQLAAKDAGTVVYLVPGIMGSQLGVPREPPLPANLLWIDPVDFQSGNLLQMRLPDQRLQSLGPVVYSYLRLKLSLAAAGLQIRYFDYDWRRSVVELGDELGQRLRAESASRLLLVGHSLGGLVARAALYSDTRIERLVTLGTPHHGSFAALQALRGMYGTVRRIAQLDPRHSAEQLAQQVFSTFPSLYEMLPRQLADFDAGTWPESGVQPDAALLEAARILRLPVDERRVLTIAGTGRPTVTRVAREGRQYRYFICADGDGTVPTSRAGLEGCRGWYCDVAHGELSRDAQVAAAVAELLHEGLTLRLAERAPAPATTVASVTDDELRLQFADKLDWNSLSAAERHAFLGSLNAPAPSLA